MRQSKLESHIESGANIASGFIISLLVWSLVVGPMINAGWFKVPTVADPVTSIDGLLITGIFTITSYLRSYVWRRFFNAGLHKAVHKWVTKWKRD